ncbi:hypothetical protein DMC30DRAFT_345458 [Rhodotorula diobovata]|uniref:SEC7 domain-containing protein n=1 Tax=Rhodotorula diobovata TaxID=5288 RepID=A0A5C5G6G0_9BASI|nr:hypothetical protein DMC30DRAFT_345458 [Rhodotorula diobovata]
MPLSEPSSASSTLSNRSKGPRGSIVGITPPLASPAAARLNASLSSSTGSFTSLASRTTTTGRGGASKRAAEAAAEEALSEGEVRDKAGRLAERAWDEDEGFLERRKIAEWLGSAGRVNAAALRLYMDRFDFQALSLDAAFRRLCGKLYLKAETQQVDRILEQFSRRYFDDNPRTVYGSSADVVHAVSYSLLLLNTDLHVVDSTTRMTRAQFIRNTLDAIHAQTGAGESELLADASPPTDSSSSVFRLGDAAASRRSLDQSGARGAGNDERPSVVSLVEGAPDLPAASVAGSPVITRTGPDGAKDSPARALSVATVPKLDEASLQAALKDVYNAIKSQPIYQISSGSGSSSALHLPQDAPAASRSSFSLSPRASIRGMGVFLGASSSLDLARSTSPTPSTATSLSDHHHVPTIGFANSLSHTIIREQHEGSGADDARSESSEVEVSDEELALLGAPWAKEGILSRKHYWESGGRRAKDKAWVQAFVVVSQGELQMFRFDGAGGGGTSRAMGGVGGGDWTANASAVGSIPLIHALCSAMPPPGYSRERPHCFVLTLPGGGSYFFQAGTPDLVAEWVSTCNYWAARLSKEPLSGGVSNMEYGWNRVAAPAAPDEDEREEIASIRSGHSRLSYASSAFHSSALGSGADRTHVNEWKPPQVPLAPSQLPEEAQLEALRKHAGIVERELAQHNALRAPMLRLYPSRSAAGTKALSNWERKAQHLVAEGTKYRTYVDALASAVRLRALRRGQKEVARMLERADAGADEDEEAEELVAGLTPYEEALSRA